jgi:hypothetical protein
MAQHDIDYRQFIHEIESLLHDIPHNEEETRDGKLFTLHTNTPKGKLTIQIDSKWVGYEFGLDDARGGYQEDTDLYPLDFNTDVTMEIFGELKNFLTDLLEHKVLWGRDTDGKSVIARPFSDGEYELRTYKDNTWWQKVGFGNTGKRSYILSKELSTKHPYLSPIK